MPCSVADLADTEITRLSAPADSDDGSLLFFMRGLPDELDFGYGACLIESSRQWDKSGARNVVRVIDPRRAAILAANLLKPYFSQREGSISATAVVHPEAKLGRNVIVMDGAVLGRCSIGDYTIIHPNVVVYDGVEIGALCEIDASATLGAEGMGALRHDGERVLKFPHFSRLIIKDNVLIGPNVTIARGVLTPTIIETGCMINAQAHVAHNARIGRRTALSMGAIVCGSARIGQGCWLAPHSTVRNQVEIADGITVGMGAVVTKSCLRLGVTLAGVPARIMKKRTG